MVSRDEQSAKIEKGPPREVFGLDSMSLRSSDRRRRMLSPSGSGADEASMIILCSILVLGKSRPGSRCGRGEDGCEIEASMSAGSRS